MPPPDRCDGCAPAVPPAPLPPELDVVAAVRPSDSLEAVAAAAAAAVAGDDSELELELEVEVEAEEGEEEEAGVVTVRAPAATAEAAVAAAPPPPPASWKPSTSLFMLSIEAWMRLAHSVTCGCVRTPPTMCLG